MKQLFRHDRDLFTDVAFKERYFSARLQGLIDRSLEDAATWTPPPDTPWARHPAQQGRYNETIFNAWDLPTSYSVGEQSVDGGTAVVPVIYYWGRGTQYEGDERVTDVELIHEAGAWRVDDLLTNEGEFIPEGSLSSTLAIQ